MNLEQAKKAAAWLLRNGAECPWQNGTDYAEDWIEQRDAAEDGLRYLLSALTISAAERGKGVCPHYDNGRCVPVEVSDGK